MNNSEKFKIWLDAFNLSLKETISRSCTNDENLINAKIFANKALKIVEEKRQEIDDDPTYNPEDYEVNSHWIQTHVRR